jgi:hypothetical protein
MIFSVKVLLKNMYIGSIYATEIKYKRSIDQKLEEIVELLHSIREKFVLARSLVRRL